MSQFKKFDCCFELAHKNIYLRVVTAPQYNNVEFSAYLNDDHQVSVCLRESKVDELIEILQEFKRQKAMYSN